MSFSGRVGLIMATTLRDTANEEANWNLCDILASSL